MEKVDRVRLGVSCQMRRVSRYSRSFGNGSAAQTGSAGLEGL